MNKDSPPTTPFERIGGAGGVERLVQRFYVRVLADGTLLPFFAQTSMEKLQRMQYEFFAAALDGPTRYSGRSLISAHHGLGIERHHLQRFLDHLLATLENEQTHLSREEIRDVYSRISIYVGEITGEGSMAG